MNKKDSIGDIVVSVRGDFVQLDRELKRIDLKIKAIEKRSKNIRENLRHAEMIYGPESVKRFREAVKKVVGVPRRKP